MSATDSFGVTVNDGHGGSSSAQVGVNITGTNDGPVISGSVNATASDHAGLTSGHVTATDVDANDAGQLGFHLDGGSVLDAGHETLVTSHGTVTLNTATGDYTFTPNAGASSLGQGQTATDSFGITVNDGHGGSTSAQVGVNITGTNDAPVVSSIVGGTGDESSTSAHTVVTGHIAAGDAEGDNLAYTVTNNAAAGHHGSLAVDANGDFTFTAVDSNWHGTDTFNVAVSDGHGGTVNQAVTVTVAPTADAAIISAPDVVYSAGTTIVGSSTVINGTTGSDIITGTSGNDVITGDVASVDGLSVPLDITAAASVAGETVSSITISNLPGGASLSAGTENDDGSWTLTPADLTGLSMSTPNNTPADLSIVVTTADGGATTDTATTLHVSFAGGFNDTITGGAGADTMYGGQGDDVFKLSGTTDGVGDIYDGGIGIDTILGGSGNDTLYVTNNLGNMHSVEVIDGGAGTDVIQATSAGETLDFSGMTLKNIESIDAGAGNDTIIGSAGADTIQAGAGDDTVVAIGGQTSGDVYDGGSGTDTLNVDLDPSQYTQAVRTELMSFATFAADPAHAGQTFTFTSLGGLKVTNFESLQVTVDGEDVNLNNPPEVREVTSTYSSNHADGVVHAVDLDSDTLTYSFGTNADGTPVTSLTTANGVVTIDSATGEYHFTANDSAFTGTDQFTVTVKDGMGGAVTQKVSLDFNPGDDATVVTGQTSLGSTNEDTQIFLRADQLLANAVDVDNTLHVENLVATDGNGHPVGGTFIAAVDAQGHEGFAFNPAANFSGDVTVTYDVVTDTGLVSHDSGSLHIEAVADAPTLDVGISASGASTAHLGNDSHVVSLYVNDSSSRGKATFDLMVGDTTVGHYSVSKGSSSDSVVNVTLTQAQHDSLLNGADLKIINTQSTSSYDLKVDKIVVDGLTFQAESATTTGSVSLSSRSLTGGGYYERLNNVGSELTFDLDPNVTHTASGYHLDLTSALRDTDGSEVQVIHVDALGTGASLSYTGTEGTLAHNADNTWDFTPGAHYDGAVSLDLSVAPGTAGFDIHVTAVATESANGDSAAVLDWVHCDGAAGGGTSLPGITLVGNAGNDILTGTAGDDLLLGGKGGADVHFSGGSRGGHAGDIVVSNTNDLISGGDGNDVIFGDAKLVNGQVVVTGGGNDVLNGGAGNDEIHGGAGNDTIIGGSGDDTMYGDQGSDTFLFDFGFGHDVVDGGRGSSWTDTIDLTQDKQISSVTIEGASGWSITVDAQGHHVAQATDPKAHDASGTVVVTNHDGSQNTIEFHNMEKVTW